MLRGPEVQKPRSEGEVYPKGEKFSFAFFFSILRIKTIPFLACLISFSEVFDLVSFTVYPILMTKKFLKLIGSGRKTKSASPKIV